MRRPGYLDLVLRHEHQLERFGVITPDVLQYLDATDKVLAREEEGARADPAAFQDLLASLARVWQEQRRLRHSHVRTQVAAVTEQVAVTMNALISEGVLQKEKDGTYTPDREKLALGMGLFIRDALVTTPEDQRTERLQDILEPGADTDEKVRWLRAAVTTSIILESPSAIIDLLVSKWWGSRNFSPEDLENLRALTPALLPTVLRMIVSDTKVDASIISVAEAMINSGLARQREQIGEACKRILRLTPSDCWINDNRDDSEAVALAVSDAAHRDLHLQLIDVDASDSVRARQRFVLSLASRVDGLIGPDDLVALTTGRRLTLRVLQDGEIMAARMLLRDVAMEWFTAEAKRARRSDARLRAIHAMVRYASRADLDDLRRELDAATSYSLQSPPPNFDVLDEARVLRTAEEARSVAIDPRHAHPSDAWLERFKEIVRRKYTSPSTMPSGYDRAVSHHGWRHIEPAVAAWAPEIGAHVIRSFIDAIPHHHAEGHQTWSGGLASHAALVSPQQRELLTKLHVSKPDDHSCMEYPEEVVYLAAVAGCSPLEHLKKVLEHPFDFDWAAFYDAAALLVEDSLRAELEAVVRDERDERVRARARGLLARIGWVGASAADLAPLSADLDGQDEEKTHAYYLLENTWLDASTSADELQVLIKEEAVRNPWWQYEAYLDVAKTKERRTAVWLARAHAAPDTARRNGATAASDEAAVMQGIQIESARIEDEIGGENGLIRDQVPDVIVEQLPDDDFNRWTDILLRSRKGGFHAGLHMPMLRRALRRNDPAARDLWTLAYPFQRNRYSSGMRYVDEGLPWQLTELHNPELDDTLACSLLRDLIADSRSDSEMIFIALASRRFIGMRLVRVLDELLAAEDESLRARARFITGWLQPDAERVSKVSAHDSSTWVQRIGALAVRRLNRESWAREWFDKFLTTDDTAMRWAAGRLFLACSDVATHEWAWQELRQRNDTQWTYRAEAVLIVREVTRDIEVSGIQDKFLTHSVRELEHVVHPWRDDVSWEDIEITEREDPPTPIAR